MGRKKKRYPQGGLTDPAAAGSPFGQGHHMPLGDAMGVLQPMAWSGFDGAKWSDSRGNPWWPTLETKDELDSYSRSELYRKIRWLHANVGMFRGFVNNAADLVGWLTPKPATKDKEWNLEWQQAFEDFAGTAAAFDVAGKYDFWTAQPMLMRCALKDGDALTVLTSAQNGSPRVAFYEAHQFANPDEAQSTRWSDGVLLDATGRHLSYGLRGDGKVVTVSAADAVYFGEFDSPGHGRVVPKLAHAVTTGIDITEIRGFTKQALKVASLFGAVREAQQAAIPQSRQGMSGAPATATNAEGDKFEVSKVWGGGQIPRMPIGEQLKLLSDSRPHPNMVAFLEILARDISVGYGLPPEVIWQMSSLTGPGIRFVMDVAERWIKCRQLHLENWCRRIYVWTTAKKIKSGQLRMPKDRDWWRVRFVPQRNLTIDRGKEAKSRMDAVANGMDTFASWYEEMKGEDWQHALQQRVAEVQYGKELCESAGLDYREVFPFRMGISAAAADANAAEPDADDEGDPPQPEPKKKGS